MVSSDGMSRSLYVRSRREGNAGKWNMIQFRPKDIPVTRGGMSAADGITG